MEDWEFMHSHVVSQGALLVSMLSVCTAGMELCLDYHHQHEKDKNVKGHYMESSSLVIGSSLRRMFFTICWSDGKHSFSL